MVSVVIPTYNIIKINISLLMEQITTALADTTEHEGLFIDDGGDKMSQIFNGLIFVRKFTSLVVWLSGRVLLESPCKVSDTAVKYSNRCPECRHGIVTKVSSYE